MDRKQRESISKFISLILRHKPHVIGVSLDEGGWVSKELLIEKLNSKFPFNVQLLDEIVELDSKNRYSYSEDGRFIRANHGHSIEVNLGLEPTIPPEFLYHGTSKDRVDSIEKSGLLPMSRQYVHLTTDVNAAAEVGKRHGKLILYKISSLEMYEDGYQFIKSASGLYLTKIVPTDYMEEIVLEHHKNKTI